MFAEVEKKVLSLVRQSLKECFPHQADPVFESALGELSLEIPKEKDFGDLSCNAAMRLSRILRKAPGSIALLLADRIKSLLSEPSVSSLVSRVEVKGAGFLNFFLSDEVLCESLRRVCFDMGHFVQLDEFLGRKILLEFVSANPTGPLSVAHARQAAVGDALRSVLQAVGCVVSKEYYLNDEGNQINILGRSIGLRFLQMEGQVVEFPDDYYQGDYIVDLARKIFDDEARKAEVLKMSAQGRLDFFTGYGVDEILAVIQKELEDFGVVFDIWYSQRSLNAGKKIEKAFELLRARSLLYEKDGALWFKSTEFGDDKDRVVRKSDSSLTYLAPDIAYHKDKFDRGFERLINIWGPDHHGYIPRMKAAVCALGFDQEALNVIIVQLATLFRDGQPAPMSTRKGQYVTLREVLTEVGRDAARFFFLMRKTDSHLDFDLELAKKHTSDNPVYYVQYAHARISGILSASKEAAGNEREADLCLLRESEERDLAKAVFEFGYCLEICAHQLDPYPLTVYLQQLATTFHRFYDKHKVLSNDPELSRSRLFLIRAVRAVLARGLQILGVGAPDRM